MHPAGDGDRSALCDTTASQLCSRVAWPSDTELLVRRRLPVHEPESTAAWMGSAVFQAACAQAACAPGCDHALSDDEAEACPLQRTAELVDGAR